MVKRMKGKSVALSLLLLSGSVASFGYSTPLRAATTLQQQTQECKGVIVDESNEPIIGASIIVKGTSHGTITNLDGNFALAGVKIGDKLEISYVGYVKQMVEWRGKALHIVLKSDTKQIDEVVVVAYGTAKKESLVGAQSSVSSKQLEKRPITNISSALNGLSSGIQSVTSSGQPGSDASIMIRGFGSINASSKPLYVVDGSIYNGSLSDIVPSDIKSVSILKDAASTSLYGSSAGNGVILITTKNGSGNAKGKPHFTFTTNQGVTAKGQDDYEKVGVMEHYPLRWQQWYNEYVYTNHLDPQTASIKANQDVYEDLRYLPYEGIKTGYVFDKATKQYSQVRYTGEKGQIPLIVMPNGTLNPEICGVLWDDDLDWEKGLYRNGYRQEYTLSGGMNTDKMESFMSLGYLNEQGYRIKTSFERYSGRANVSYTVNDKIKLGTNISFSRVHNEAPKVASGGYSANGFMFVSGIAPIYPIHKHTSDGTYILDSGKPVYDHSYNRPYLSGYNPIQESYLDLSTFDRDALTNRTFGEYSFMDNLKLRVNVSYDLSRAIAKTRYNNVMGDRPQGGLMVSDDRISTVTFNQLLTYNKEIGKHHFDLLLGHESYWMRTMNLSGNKTNMGILGLDEFPNFSEAPNIDSNTDTYAKEGYFTRLNYNYGSKYNASVSYRRDGTSRLSKKNRWGNFWSVGLGWNLTSEPFMQNISWLNNLKLRASIGQTGNDALNGYYSYLTQYVLGENNNETLGARFSHMGNTDLLWETQTSYDLAVEFALFHRLRGSIELFNKESSNLIFDYPLPVSTGIGSVDKNIGKVRNYGVEVELKSDIIEMPHFSWRARLNATFLKNKIVTLPEANRKDGIEFSYFKYMEGHSIYDYYLTEWIGVDPATGMAIYRIDKEQFPSQADPNNESFVGMEKTGEKSTWTTDGNFAKKHFSGTSIPTVYGGFGTNFTIYGVDLAIDFAYQLGGKTYDGRYQRLMGRDINSGSAAHKDMLKAWKHPGQVTDVPRLDAGTDGQYDSKSSDRFLTSSNALMLKSIVASYTLPHAWATKLGLEDISLGVAAENLFLLSARKGLNPMNNYSGVVGTAGYEYAKTLTSTISVKF